MQQQVQSQQVSPRPIQPSEIALRSVPMKRDQAQEDIRNFLRALDSYPARVAEEPRLSFHEHLCSIFADGGSRDHRRDH